MPTDAGPRRGDDLAGRVALVTGAARNIGRAIALDLAAGGAAVVVAARSDRAAAAETVAAIEATGGRAAAAFGDVADPAAAEGLVRTALDAFGGLDILVNNAAVRNEAPFDELSYEAWREVLAATLDGAFLVTRAAVAALSRSDRAAIVNIGGLTAYTGAARRVHVVAAKAGLDGLTKALAHDLAGRGITVNLVSPGLIETARTGARPHHHGSRANLLGRRGAPEEVAAMVRFLAGPDARYVTGQALHVNGGAYLG